MKIANLAGRLVIVDESGTAAADVETLSASRFAADPQLIYARWREFREWARALSVPMWTPFAASDLGAPTPAPTQIFAIGTNYSDHAAEVGLVATPELSVFTKYQSAISGPVSTVVLPPDGTVDWEVELTVVIAEGGRGIPQTQAWDRVAGLTIAQDISERRLQTAAAPPQFSLGKSHAGFLPIGPVVATVDEFPNRDDIPLKTTLSGDVVQDGRTGAFIRTVPELVAMLSAVVELLPGDIILTGTPAGVGAGRKPPRFIQPGEVLVSEIAGIGRLEQTFVAP